jgi:osmotically-inducible protein OsmY
MSTQLALVNTASSIHTERNEINQSAVHELGRSTVGTFVRSSSQHFPADHLIGKAAKHQLRASPYDLRSIMVEAHDGILELHGNVISYFHKQVAQETLRGMEGVRAVQNSLQVIDWAKRS